MSAQAPTPARTGSRQAGTGRRRGRPRKRDGVAPTRDRLLEAAVEVFVERGFEQASVVDIAERAGISGPAVYKHFDGKAELFITAARRSLDRMFLDDPMLGFDPSEAARRWLEDDFAPTRRLLLELHLAAGRDTDLAALLTEWHVERTRAWVHARDSSVDQIASFYLLLLGIAQVDVLAPLGADHRLVKLHVDRMVGALFPDSTG